MASSIQGENFVVTKESVSQDRISSEKAREQLAPDVLASLMNTISFDQLKATRLDASKKPKFEVPNLSNMTPEGAADLLGQVRETIKNLQKEEKLYSEFLKARMVSGSDQGT